MHYRRLGAAGVNVSEISLGSWLTYGGHVEDRAAEACIHRAYELGVNLFDTADVYRRGDAERVVGRALMRYPRSSYVLATKVYFSTGDGPNDRGLSRKHVIEACHASLERLGTDYIDLYQCHRFDPDAPLEETLRALDDLISAGKVLYVGVSEWSADQLDEARALGDRLLLDPIVSNQPQYSLLWRRIEDDVIPVSERLGIGQVVWSPLAQGVLTGKYRPGEPTPRDTRAGHPDPQTSQFVRLFMREDILEAVQRLGPIADDLGLTVAQLAIAWVLRQPNVASAIVGASRPEQVDENCAASGVELPPDALLRIDEAVSDVLPLQLPAG
ncbi:MAG TPA: aldo/keto reductase family protein [Solirubrobacteraceae bacterium]|jgi:aryl-alcohol dehydrogenase-like predicted oxidoreductase